MAEVSEDDTGKVNVPSPSPTSGSMSAAPYAPGVAFIEASGLLVIWSLLVINEGALRFNALAHPEVGGYPDLAMGVPPLGLSFFASLFEVIFGFIGLFLGLSGFIFHYYSTAVTKAAMVVQSVLGWFVFIIYVFLVPAFRARDLVNKMPALSNGEFRFLVTMGIFTSFHFCLALQGGQFVFMARTIVAATNSNFMNQKTGNKMRAIFWSGNLALAGLWTLMVGSFVIDRIGSGKLDAAYVFPPHLGRIPGLTVFTGLLMLLYGACGMALPFSASGAPPGYFVGGVVVFLMTWLNFTIVQLGVIGPRPLGVAMHAGLVFMVSFLGPYFNWCCCRPEYDSEVAQPANKA